MRRTRLEQSGIIWNSLQQSGTVCRKSLSIFKGKLNTELFLRSFHDI